MKKTKLLFPLLFGALVLLLTEAEAVRQAVQGGIRLCMETVIPSLFPFFVVSSLLISLGFAQLLGRTLGPLTRTLFRVGGNGASALVLGLVGGYPVGARTAAELYRSGLCDRAEAERLLAFCNNSSPAFIISVLGMGIFGSGRAGVYLYLIHVLSALLTGMLFRFWGEKGREQAVSGPAFLAVPFSTAFVQSVQAGLRAMGGVCAFVVLFQVLLLPLRAVPGPAGAALMGAVELFNGSQLLTADRTGFVLAAGLLGWGGLSVHCQALAMLGGSGLSSRSYWLGKAAQGGISLLLGLFVIVFLLT